MSEVGEMEGRTELLATPSEVDDVVAVLGFEEG